MDDKGIWYHDCLKFNWRNVFVTKGEELLISNTWLTNGSMSAIDTSVDLISEGVEDITISF